MAVIPRIEKRAWQQLRQHNLACVSVDVKALAEALGVDVTYASMEGTVSAMLSIEGGDATIVVNADHPPNRQRFSVAHEIGHYLLHASDNDLFVDRSFFRNQASSVGELRREIEANAFAAALLMPSRLIEAHTNDDGDTELYIDELASKFEVSEHAMTIRLINLDLIDA